MIVHSLQAVLLLCLVTKVCIRHHCHHLVVKKTHLSLLGTNLYSLIRSLIKLLYTCTNFSFLGHLTGLQLFTSCNCWNWTCDSRMPSKTARKRMGLHNAACFMFHGPHNMRRWARFGPWPRGYTYILLIIPAVNTAGVTLPIKIKQTEGC